MSFLEGFRPQIYALTRIVVGALFMQHGLQKIFGLFGGVQGEMPAALLYTAGGIELVGGLLVAIGLFAAPAAFLASGTMAVAYFMVHQPMGLFPIENRGEMAILYCWAFFLIAAHGSGIWSIDAARSSGGD